MDDSFRSNNNENTLQFESQDYIFKENNNYKIIIEKLNNEISFKCGNYIINININDFSLLTKIKFDTINKVYKYIIKFFDENKIIIKKIIPYKEISLLFLKGNSEPEFIITLLYNADCNKSIANEKEGYDYPKGITLIKELTKDSYCNAPGQVNTFSVFKSINDILYLIYSTFENSIICYNLINQNVINEIKQSHDKSISNMKHYLDKINKRDIIMSISQDNNNMKLWNVNNWECILNLQNINSQ